MPLQYKLVQRKDMRKGAAPDSKLYFAASHTTGKIDFDGLCDTITAMSSASRGDVSLILEGLIFVLQQRLKEGDSIRLGNFGTFKMCFGSKGSPTKEEFANALINRPKIIFRPGTMLDFLRDEVKFERTEDKVVTVTEACTKEHVI